MRYAWRDTSYETIPGRWIPEAIVTVINEATCTDFPLRVSKSDHRRIGLEGTVIASREASKTVAYGLVQDYLEKHWGVSANRLREW